MSELSPEFRVRVWLDGDDWPPTMTENAKAALDAACDQMVRDGLVKSYTVELSADQPPR